MGTTPEGALVEVAFLHLSAVDAGRLNRIEFFSRESLAEAVARFEELRSRGAIGPGLESAAVRAERRLIEAFERRNWDELRDLVAPDAIAEDHRKGRGTRVAGRASAAENFKMLAEDLGFRRVQSEVIATRGDRLELSRRLATDDSDNETEMLSLTEIDGDERIRRFLYFDIHDLEAALIELDERYMEAEGGEAVATWRRVCDLAHGYNARDWARIRSALHEDALLVDHRPAYLGTPAPGEWIRSLEVQAELAPGLHYVVVQVLTNSGRVTAYHSVATGPTVEGAEVEISFYNVAQIRDGRVARYEWFPLESLDRVLARVQELRRES